MTVINNKKNELQIVISSVSPTEERDLILKALIASVRWYGNNDYGDTRNVGNVDSQNLIVISNLIDEIIATKTIE